MKTPSKSLRWLVILVLLVVLLAASYMVFQMLSPYLAPAAPTMLPPLIPTKAPSLTPDLLPSAIYTLQQTSEPAVPLPSTATPVLTPFDLVKGPDLIYTGANTEMKIFWQWSGVEVFRLDWGTDETYALGSVSITPYDEQNNLYAHTITGLAPGTRYLYRVVLGSQVTAGSFQTAPESSAKTLKFVSYGDTRTHPDLHDAVAAQVVALYQSDPLYQTFNLHVGDLVRDGDTDSDWTEEFFSTSLTHIRAELANIAVLPVMGNHEGAGVLFSRYFPMPFVQARYWSFDYGPAHVAMLDQYVDYGIGSAQYEWLKNDLASSGKTWKFVVLHEPGWSAGSGHENQTIVQTDIQPLLMQYGVAMLIAGHNHYYARAVVNDVTHLTVGTGGAPLYGPSAGYPYVVSVVDDTGYARFEIDGDTLTGWFIDSRGVVRDRFTIMR